MFLPTILRGSAIVVTYISDIARFAMKIHSNLCNFSVVKIVIKIRTFPNVPNKAANASVIKIGIATPGASLTN